MTPFRFKTKLATLGLALGIMLISNFSAFADPFCRDVLDSFNFEQGVFAGPDPDILPNRINDYIQTRIEHQVNKGQLTGNDARYLLDSLTNELRLFQDIANTCNREPGSGIRLIDRLLEPHFNASSLNEQKAESGNQKAHETLDTVWKACQVFWMEQDTPVPCALDKLKDEDGKPLFLPEGLEVKIEDGSMAGFHARARHHKGNREYVMNAQGDIFENLIQEINNR